jgi:hypothetical protein
MDWQRIMRAGLFWACFAGVVLAYEALAGYPDPIAAWIVLGGLGTAALGWYLHQRARMAFWRTMTGRNE